MILQSRISPLVTACLIVALYGCGPADGAGHDAGGRQDDGWTTPPRIETVSLSGRQAVIRGMASPEARVVLRGDGGEMFAGGADDKGRFELTLSLPDELLVLVPEVRQGQDAIKGPQRLVILTSSALAVIQTDGGGSQRLTPGPSLDAIDSDGKVLVASGRGRVGAVVRISVPGTFETTVKVGDDLRWSTGLMGVQQGPFTLKVNDDSYDYPGASLPLEANDNQKVEAAGSGWRLTRRLDGKAFLVSWFPNR